MMALMAQAASSGGIPLPWLGAALLTVFSVGSAWGVVAWRVRHCATREELRAIEVFGQDGTSLGFLALYASAT